MRHDDSPELFGGGCGAGTSGDIECDICHEKYNQGADEAEDYADRTTVCWTDFAGLTVCDCCFWKIEEEVLKRMPQIIPWYQKIVEERLKKSQMAVANLGSLKEVIKKDEEQNG